jgi:hypothetical protein
MPQVDWNLIIETIRAEKCVVLLGPDFATTKDGKHILEVLLEKLEVGKDEGLKFLEPDSLFQFKDPILRTRTYFKIKSIYREIWENIDREPYLQLAQIGVPLIMSLSPDPFLHEAMNELNVAHRFTFYNKTVNPPEMEAPSRDNPLVFNIFGSIDEEQSLILTHKDLYDFLFSILGDHHLPNELKTTLHGAANVLFLGFSFDKWYMQLLLRLLNLHDERYNFDRYAAQGKLKEEVRVFFNEQFRINFVDTVAGDFVKTLYEKCKEAGLTRDLSKTELLVSDQVTSYIENDQLEDAITALSTFFKTRGEQDLEEEIVLLSGRYKRLQRKIQQEVVDEKEADIDSNKIQMALLEINKEVKRLEAA